jgi:hypothetical protein
VFFLDRLRIVDPTSQDSTSVSRSNCLIASLDVCQIFELGALNSKPVTLDSSSQTEESNICLYSDDENYQCGVDTDYDVFKIERITSTISTMDGLDFSEAFGATLTGSPVGLEDYDLLDFGDG